MTGAAHHAPAGPRSVEEWIGKTPDTPIPLRVRIRVFERYGGVCQLKGRKIRPGEKWQCDHIIALVNGGEHRESNLWPALEEAHRAKTAEDVKIKSKIARVKAKHLGLKGSNPRSLKPPPGARYDWSRGRYVKESR